MKKVIVGMSGGIDSSVAALLLKNEGYEVVGVSLKHLSDDVINSKNKTCCSLDDINDARIVCFSLGVPHYVINVEKEFTKEVITEFLKEYKKGYTPNPCVICNEKVKISALINLAKKLNFDYIATGHYAVKSEDGFMFFSESIKDQTYMLYRISKKDLDMILFPLGNINKLIVRQIAKENNIVTHDKKDSQGICFAPDGYEKYLSTHLDLKEGNFIDSTGKIIGKHKGYALYTLGQRRHLGIKSPHPLFITNIDNKTNTITVGSFENLLIDTIEIFNYIFHKKLEDFLEKELIARPRFSSRGLSGKLFITDNKLFFKYNEKNAQNAKGQHIVFYFNNELIGGGEIK
ncbi:tRNA 2-thiouridine(34) synthase MnmA [Caviibacter abscessus]|uniref:tRNA 2-thiouridine(34) synthase MnmA n=1 Tax=Caviibacter abscessus TaxID=1766719 RepID=UPI00082BEB30|nr:tRNA 2-thiouridine(34) synthase MnmA [Caviibacter abscessus]